MAHQCTFLALVPAHGSLPRGCPRVGYLSADKNLPSLTNIPEPCNLTMFSRVIQRLGGKAPLSAMNYCTAAPTTMEKTLNQVTLLGRAGMEPQRRGTAEHPVVVFSLATHFTYKQGNGEMLQKTEWHRVSVFRPYLRDKVENFLAKGQRILVTGRVSYGEYKDDNDVVRSATTIIADDVIFFTPSNNRK